MSHNTAALFMLASLFFLTMGGRPLAAGLGAGVFFGLLFNTRQLAALALLAPFALILLLPILARGEQRAMALRRAAGFVTGGLLMGALYFAYRYGTTGDAVHVSAVQAGGDAIGFGGAHSVRLGIANEQVQMAHLLLVLDMWPFAGVLLFALGPFILGSHYRWDWILLASALLLISAYTLYTYHGLMYGPRFWFEAIPFLFLLAARGIARIAAIGATFAQRLWRPREEGDRAAGWAGALPAASFVVVMSVLGAHQWLRSGGDDWHSDFVPHSAQAMRGFNGMNDRLVRVLDSADLEDALVIAEECPPWWCHGNVYWLNAPSLDGDVVYAKEVPERYRELFAAYPDRRVFKVSYGSATLIPFREGQAFGAPVADAAELAAAPFARDIPLPSPTPGTPATPMAASP